LSRLCRKHSYSLVVVKISTRQATSADVEFARSVHHAGYRALTERVSGWDEALQDQLFTASWRAATYSIVLCAGVPCGYLSWKIAPTQIGVREVVIAPTLSGKPLIMTAGPTGHVAD